MHILCAQHWDIGQPTGQCVGLISTVVGATMGCGHLDLQEGRDICERGLAVTKPIVHEKSQGFSAVLKYIP